MGAQLAARIPVPGSLAQPAVASPTRVRVMAPSRRRAVTIEPLSIVARVPTGGRRALHDVSENESSSARSRRNS